MAEQVQLDLAPTAGDPEQIQLALPRRNGLSEAIREATRLDAGHHFVGAPKVAVMCSLT